MSIWTKDNPPPKGLHLFVRVSCPGCGEPLHFGPIANVGNRCIVRCDNLHCTLVAMDYEIVLNEKECVVL
jgi:hypothetical protein